MTEEDSITAAEERARRWLEQKDGSLGGQLQTLLDKLGNSLRGIKPMTPAEEREWEWENRVKPQLRSLGVKDAHLKRIAPNWGCKAQEQAFQAVKAHCRMTGAIVALVGNRGLGKTQIATEIMRERVEARFDYFRDPFGRVEPYDPGRYAKLSELGAMFKPLYADFGSVNAEALTERLNSWCALPLLTIDEIHEEEDLKTRMRLLTDICDRRYANSVDTILISNHSADTFKSEINPSILSRLSEHGAIIECSWNSWRAR